MKHQRGSVPKLHAVVANSKPAIPVEVRPLHDRVIVKRVAKEEASRGGIIIPDTAKEKPQEGQVVAVGPGRRDDNGRLVPMGVAKGDRILFAKYSGSDVHINGEEHLILQETDILGVIAK